MKSYEFRNQLLDETGLGNLAANGGYTVPAYTDLKGARHEELFIKAEPRVTRRMDGGFTLQLYYEDFKYEFKRDKTFSVTDKSVDEALASDCKVEG